MDREDTEHDLVCPQSAQELYPLDDFLAAIINVTKTLAANSNALLHSIFSASVVKLRSRSRSGVPPPRSLAPVLLILFTLLAAVLQSLQSAVHCMLQATDGGQRTLRTQVPAKPTDEGSQEVIKSPPCSSPVSRVHQVVSHGFYHVLVTSEMPLPPSDKNNLICGKLHPQSWDEPFVSAEVTSPLSAQTQTNASCLSVL